MRRVRVVGTAIVASGLGSLIVMTAMGCSNASRTPSDQGQSASSATGSNSMGGQGATATVERTVPPDSRACLQFEHAMMYSAFDGVHEFKVPVAVKGVDPAAVKWTASEQGIVDFERDDGTGGVMITTRKAGKVRIIATAGDRVGSASLTIVPKEPRLWDLGNARYNNNVPLKVNTLNSDTACANCHAGDPMPMSPERWFPSGVLHTPQQTAGYTDSQLVDIFTMGIKPTGAMYRTIDRSSYEGVHRWEVLGEAREGLVSYLRSLPPRIERDETLPSWRDETEDSPLKLNAQSLFSAFDGKHEFKVSLQVLSQAAEAVQWSSSNPELVTLIPVDNDDTRILIRTRGAGKTEIKAVAGKRTASATLEIVQRDAKLWDVGYARYKSDLQVFNFDDFDPSAGATEPPQPDINPKGSCTSCHSTTPESARWDPGPHTPEQVQTYTDAQLIAVVSQGVWPDGRDHKNVDVVDPQGIGHRWELSDMEKEAIVVYMRSLEPARPSGYPKGPVRTRLSTTGDCRDPNGYDLVLTYSPMYSAFDGMHEFQVPVTVSSAEPLEAPVQWEASDPEMVDIDREDESTVMLTTRKAGTVTITARSGARVAASRLVIGAADPADWKTGEQRYNKPRDPNSMDPFTPGENTGCALCHHSGGVQHTPYQTAGYSDDELVRIFTTGTKPANAVFRTTLGPDFYQLIHHWTATEQEKRGLILYLRSLSPMPQGRTHFDLSEVFDPAASPLP